MALDTATGSGGSQTSTQSPQTATGSSFGAGSTAGGMQPGVTGRSLDQSSGGIPLQPVPLTTVDLSQTSSQTQQATAKQPVESQGFNPALLGISALFLVIAVVWFWFTTRAEKNTTD